MRIAVLVACAAMACAIAAVATAAPAAPTLASVGLDPAAIDRSVSPCDDLYQFACGAWNAQAVIPADEASWYRSFDEMERRTARELRAWIERAARDPGQDGAARRAGAFYAACTAALGGDATPTDRLDWKIPDDKVKLWQALARAHRLGVRAWFSPSVEPDYRDATKAIVWLDQAGLGLPDRDDYVADDERSKALRAVYLSHVAAVLTHFGVADAERKAAVVQRIETLIARASKTNVLRRDPAAMYHKVDRDGLARLAPHLDWASYFDLTGVGSFAEVAVTSPEFFAAVDRIWQQESAADLGTYLMWHTARDLAPHHSAASAALDFALERKLTGQPDLKPVWRRCLDAADRAVGDLVAAPWVAQRFGATAQARAGQMVGAIGAAFLANLDRLDWMDAATRAKAADKARQMQWLVGRPGTWKTYDFAIGPLHSANVAAGREAAWQRKLARLGRLVDRSEWLMSAPAVNAYYDPQKNHMVFPAGILQPPFFDPKAALPVNLGAIGMVIGHELTHGFDDEGSQFDAVGGFSQWWQSETRARFVAKTRCVVDQFDRIEVLPGLRINGTLTLGENIADLGGLKLAFAAYRSLRAKDPAGAVIADGYSEDQQFFLAHAQAWCGAMRDDALRRMVATNPHSPPKWRVNAPAQNLPEFRAAFGCKAGAPMAPAQTCAVW